MSMPEQEPGSVSEPQTSALASSDKCDFRFRSPALEARISSDKCDWRFAGGGLQVTSDRPEAVRDLRAHIPGAHLRVDSDKCDWRIRVADSVRDFKTDVEAMGPELSVRASAPRFQGSLSSSKCDFSVRASQPGPGRTPELHADVISSQREVSLRIRFGLRGGRTYRLRIDGGSDKCDFRIFREMDDLRESSNNPDVLSGPA